MEYYESLGLVREPFMDTADPYFFYQSHSHKETLQRLEISVRLGRGLNLILGDVGTGKTTLAQALEMELIKDDTFVTCKIMDPTYSSEEEFLEAMLMLFQLEPQPGASRLSIKNTLKNHLYHLGVEQNKRVVLVIDEGQKLTYPCLENLRLFLNYQTPQRKLLNIVIFSQLEILPVIRAKANFTDRIAVLYKLEPFSREETHRMIDYRLQRAGLSKPRDLFTTEAKDLIFERTRGKPRRITMLCHNAVEEAIIRNQDTVDADIIRALTDRFAGLPDWDALAEEAQPLILPSGIRQGPATPGISAEPAARVSESLVQRPTVAERPREEARPVERAPVVAETLPPVEAAAPRESAGNGFFNRLFGGRR
ncbi:MAG: transposase [Armatimonadetes bacterium]|nr:transposase [Armatimonadota bacterium]